jgi:prevent-host-death family protein
MVPNSLPNPRRLFLDNLEVILVTMSELVALKDVKAHLSEIVARVHAEHDRITVSVHGRPMAVLMSADDVEAMEETIAVLSDRSTMTRLEQAEADIAQGDVESADELAEAMRRRRESA